MSNVKCVSTAPIDNEDKSAWCVEGERREEEFINLMSRHTHLKVSLNPEKITNKYAPDLVVSGYGICDLKAVQTPFFLCGKEGFDPYFTITLNTKDIYRYREKYPGLSILFWVTWPAGINGDGRYRAQPYKWAVYEIKMTTILEIVDSGLTPYHPYKNRQQFKNKPEMQAKGMDDKGNALGSYFIDVRWMEPVASSLNPPNFTI